MGNMNENNTILIKLYNGDMLIGKKTNPKLEETTNPQVWGRIILKDPRQIMIIPTMSGDIQMAITKVCHPFKVKRLEEEIFVNSTQVMYTLEENEIDKELLNGYMSEISGIKIATASETAMLNNKDGDFTIQ